MVSSTHSHENLAFEVEEKLLEPQNTSTDSTTSTMETTLESTTSDESRDIKDAEESRNDSGISVTQLNKSDVATAESNTISGSQEVTDAKGSGNDSGTFDSQMNGSDVDPTTRDVHENNGTEPGRDIRPAFKVLGTFAMELAMTSPPEIKVDKPKTLSSLAKGDSTDASVSKKKVRTSPSPRRHTDHNINKDLQKKSTLTPDAALIKRRHSDFVSAPKSPNEELALEDLKRRGSGSAASTEKPRKGSIPELVRKGRGPQWSPNMERKRQEEAKTGHKKDERRKTLAELAEAHGYKPNVQEPLVAVETQALQVAQEDPAKGSRESLNEVEDEHYSSIPVTGELYVSLRYEMRSNKFELHIHNANNLASADPKKGTSDPYVKSYLLPDKRSKRKTKTKKETLNPNFDEILEYFIGYDELLTRTLFLSVWHKALGRNEFLGEVKIPMNDFVEAHGNTIQQWVAKWFTLTDKRDATDGLPSNPCELVLALKYVTSDKVKNKKGKSKGELHVHLLEARNLPGMDADGMSDPYCKCYLLPYKKGKSKYKTPIIKRTLNPTFDHKFSYEEVSLEELKEKVLEIAIYDFDRASTDDFLGGVRLGLGTSSNEWDDATKDESQIWQTMLSRSNVWIQVVVPLRSRMVSMKNC